MGIKHSRPVPPFMRYCSAIIPTMFDDSLSYYEALCALNRFIQDNLVEVINNNASVTQEYIRIVDELKEYVEHYFDNLDVQEEINNKLDEMVESGEFQEAIAPFFEEIAGLNDSYYTEISYEETRVSETDCYIVKVPKFDSNGDEIVAHVNYDENLSPLQYAEKNHTSLTINASISVDSEYEVYPNIISDGEIVVDYPYYGNLPDYTYFLGIKEGRVLATYPYNTSAQTMLDDGCLQAFLTFGKIVEGGVAVEATYGNATVDNPRMALGIKADGTFVIFACDGRIGDNEGLKVADVSEIMIAQGCVTAWNLDGGGSTSLNYKGSKMNRNIDGEGTRDRAMHCTLNFVKPVINVGVGNSYSNTGFEKQSLIKQIFGSFVSNNAKDFTDADLNDCIGNLYVGYGNDLTNSYKNRQGYFINIPHSYPQYKNLYNLQLFASRDYPYIYMRSMINGDWSDWEIVSATNKKSFATASNIHPSESGSYEKLKFSQQQDQTSIIYMPEDQTSENYSEFKINRVGYCTIKLQCEYEATEASNKFARLYKNDDTQGTMSFKSASNARGTVTREFYFYNDDVDNLYTVAWNGATTDTIRSFDIIVETN